MAPVLHALTDAENLRTRTEVVASSRCLTAWQSDRRRMQIHSVHYGSLPSAFATIHPAGRESHPYLLELDLDFALSLVGNLAVEKLQVLPLGLSSCCQALRIVQGNRRRRDRGKRLGLLESLFEY